MTSQCMEGCIDAQRLASCTEALLRVHPIAKSKLLPHTYPEAYLRALNL